MTASPISIHLALAADATPLGPALAGAVAATLGALAAIAAIGRLRDAYGGDLLFAIECRLARTYLELVHRVRFEGFDAIP